MSTEENKALIRRFIEDVANPGNLDAMHEFISPHMIDHTGAAGQAPGIENLMRAATLMSTAFPPWRTEIEDIIAEGDKVMLRTRQEACIRASSWVSRQLGSRSH